MEGDKIKSFTGLRAWQEAHKLVLAVYQITKKFPQEEIFCLVNQMRRCVVSVTSNIAEGFGRQSYKEKTQFYYIAQGSITELQNQLLISRDVGYIDNEKFQAVSLLSVNVGKILSGLIKASKSRF